MFAYIVDDKYTSIDSRSIECEKKCTIYDSLRNDNIHYEGHAITQFDIDNLNMGSVLLGDLEKVDWVVLKCAYEITNGSEQQEYFYYMNNHTFFEKNEILE